MNRVRWHVYLYIEYIFKLEVRSGEKMNFLFARYCTNGVSGIVMFSMYIQIFVHEIKLYYNLISIWDCKKSLICLAILLFEDF